jgi:hypothetical protein
MCFVQVFGAIEGDVDATHRIMHNALSGYADARLWRLTSLDGYTRPSDKQLEPELAKEFGAWRCHNSSCDGSACTLWHDERELRFAKVWSPPLEAAAPGFLDQLHVCITYAVLGEHSFTESDHFALILDTSLPLSSIHQMHMCMSQSLTQWHLPQLTLYGNNTGAPVQGVHGGCMPAVSVPQCTRLCRDPRRHERCIANLLALA